MRNDFMSFSLSRVGAIDKVKTFRVRFVIVDYYDDVSKGRRTKDR